LSILSPELSGKRLELLKEIIPKLSRVAVFGTSTNPGYAQQLREIELAAGAFGVQLQYLDILDPNDIKTAFRAASKERADAVLVMAASGAVRVPYQTKVVEFEEKRRPPAIYPNAQSVEAGGFMSYGVNQPDFARRAATFVDKILKGAKPADLP